jgi:hypothetical protein
MSTTAWLSVPRVSVHPAASSRREPVPQVAFGGGAQAGEHLRAAQQFEVRGTDVRRVHDRGPRPEHVFVVQQPGRRNAVNGPAGIVLTRLLGHVDVQRSPPAATPGHDRVHLLGRHRADRVEGRAGPRAGGDHAAGVEPERVHTLRPPGRVAVAEPHLRTGERQHPGPVETTGQVAGVEQGQAQASLGRRLDQGPPHRVGVSVGTPVRPVVQVVELADAAHPGQRHLGVNGPGQLEIAVRVEPGRGLVHALTPGPEGPPACLGTGPERAVEGMRVRVGEAGQGETAEAGGG